MAETNQRTREEVEKINNRDIYIEIQDLKQTLAATNPEISARADIKTLAAQMGDLSERIEKIENHLSNKTEEKKKKKKESDTEEEEPQF